MNGVEKEYFENGKLEMENIYTEGVANGMQKWYYPSGKLKTEMQWFKGNVIDRKDF